MSASSAPSAATEGRPRRFRRLREVLLAVAAVVLSLGALDFALRARAWLAPKGAPLGAYFRHDATYGWFHRPGVRLDVGFPEAVVEVVINAAGLRGGERPEQPAPGVTRILALGDSFAFGWAVAEEDGVARRIESRLKALGPGVEVVNAGVSGYATDQELLLYRNLGRRFAPSLVLLFFYGNDVVYNARDNYWRGAKPYFTAEGQELVLRNVPVPAQGMRAPAEIGYAEGGRTNLGSFVRGRLGQGAPRVYGWLARLGLWPALTREAPPDERRVFERAPPPFVEESWAMTARLLRQLDVEVAADGARLVVVYVPDRIEVADRSWRLACLRYGWTAETADSGAVRRRLGRIASEAGLRTIDLSDPLRASDRGVLGGPYFSNGIHWNAAGHGVAADAIATRLVEGGLLR